MSRGDNSQLLQSHVYKTAMKQPFVPSFVPSSSHHFKLLLLGDPCVGKSSLIARYISHLPPSTPPSACNLTFVQSTQRCKQVEISGQLVTLRVWNSVGYDRFRCVRAGLFHEVDGIIVVYDLTNRLSFDRVLFWMHEIEEYGPAVNSVLVGNKSDLGEERTVTFGEGKELADMLGVKFVETSALSSHNVEKCFEVAAADVLHKKTENATKRSSEVETRSENSGNHWCVIG